MWHYLHTMSFNYPVNPTKRKKIINVLYCHCKMFYSCKYCRINLKNFQLLPLTDKEMTNRDTFSRYIYNLHETVNKMLKKKSGLKFCDVRERYEHFRSRCTLDKPKLIKKIHLNKTKKEKGCTEPLYGKKSKCIIKIVPQEEKQKLFKWIKNV